MSQDKHKALKGDSVLLLRKKIVNTLKKNPPSGKFPKSKKKKIDVID
jgi:hypothetical protein